MGALYVRDVGHQSGVNVNSDGGSFATLPIAGNSIIVLANCWNRAMAAGNVTDNQTGNTYALDAQIGPTSNTATASIYSDVDIGTPSGTFTITVNPGGSGDWFEWIAVEFSGLVDSAALDHAATAAGTDLAPTVSGNTTAQAEELWIGVCGVTDNSTVDISMDLPAGWTQLSYLGNPAGTIAFLGAYKIVSATGVLTFNAGGIVRGPSGGWAIAVAGYKASAGGGATQFDVSVGGAMTPAGALLRQPNKAFTGALTPAGAMLKAVQRIFAGAMTPAGALLRQAQKLFAGALTPAGALANIKIVLLALAGTVASSGALVRSVSKQLAGSLTPAGGLVRQVQKAFAGTVTSSGAAAIVRTILISLAGSVASAGGLIRQVGKALGGTITPTGSIARHLSLTFSGTVAASGAAFKQIPKFFSGTVTSAGSLVNQIIGSGQMFRPTLNFVMTIVKVLKKQGS